MATIPEICNLALNSIRQTRIQIQNLETDQSKIARIIRLHYDIIRQSMLADHDWNFGQKTLALNLIEEESVDTDWHYVYDYPVDCIKIRRLKTKRISYTPLFETEVIPYRINIGKENRKQIITPQIKAYIDYTLDVTNPQLFPATFTLAFAYHLALVIAPAITEDISLQSIAAESYAKAYTAALKADSAEEEVRQQPMASWDYERLVDHNEMSTNSEY